MSLIKVKFIKSKARRTKLRNRNKIKHLQNRVKKLKIDKNALVEQLQQNMEDLESTEEGLKTEMKKVDNLKKQIECPICLEVPRKGPVFTCPNGHLVCHRCKQDACPTCKEAVGDNKSLLAVAVIESILHDCKFDECEEEFSLQNIEDHEKVCKHRFVACPYGQCDQRVPLLKLLGHLEGKPCSSNSVPKEVGKSPGIGKYQVSNIQLLDSPRLGWKVKTYSYKGSHFALCVNKLGEYWQFTAVMFESLDVCWKYNIVMEVYARNSDPVTRTSAKVCCNPCSIDQSVAEMKGLGLLVHHKFMEKMMLKEEGFKFMVSLSFL